MFINFIFLSPPNPARGQPRRKNERLSRRKFTLIKKAHELAKFCDVDVALIIRTRKNGRYFTYDSIDLESWLPSKEHIVRQLFLPLKISRDAVN
jgi:hypothetical protein